MLGYLASRSVGMAPASLRSPAVDPAEGYALLFLPSIRQHVETTFSGLVGHRRGWWQDHALIAVDVRLTRAAQFWSALAPIADASVMTVFADEVALSFEHVKW